MGVASYFEFVTTLLGWIVYEGIWAVVVDTGLVFLPLIAMVITNVKSSLAAGDDEGTAAIQSLKKIEVDFYSMLFVIVFAAIPVLDVELSDMEYVKPALRCGDTAQTIDGDNTGTTYDRTLSAIGTREGRIPLWWALFHTLSKGITAGSIAALPCSPELSTVEYRLANDAIEDPGLREEIAQFTDDCYRRARSRLQRSDTTTLTTEQLEDVHWLGSSYFLTTAGYYDRYNAQRPQAQFPFNPLRDAGYDANAISGGHPVCTQWWSDAGVGVRAKVLDSIDSDLLDDMVYGTGNLVSASTDTVLTVTEREDILLRKYLAVNRVRNALATDLPMSVGYQDSAGMHALDRMHNPTHLGDRLLGSLSMGYGFLQDVGRTAIAGLGGAMKAPAAIGEGYMIRQGLPIVQAIVLMLLIVVLPFLMIFSQYRLSVLVTFTVIFFGLHFMSFLWALAYWLDNNLMALMTDGARFGVFAPVANPVQSGIVLWTNRLLYLVFPVLYLTGMGWAGIYAGQLATSFTSFGSSLSGLGAAGGNAAASVATKGKV